MDPIMPHKLSRKASEIQFQDQMRIRESMKLCMDMYSIQQTTINTNQGCFSIMNSFTIAYGERVREFATTVEIKNVQ